MYFLFTDFNRLINVCFIFIDPRSLRLPTLMLSLLLKKAMTIASKCCIYTTLCFVDLLSISSPPFTILQHKKPLKSHTVVLDDDNVAEKDENLDEYDLADSLM